jgi:preprotein translocase subunit YajC
VCLRPAALGGWIFAAPVRETPKPCHAVDGEAPNDYPTPASSGISGRRLSFGAAVSSSPLLSNELLLAQNVQPRTGTPGVAQDPAAAAPGGASPQAGGGSPIAGFMPILMMLVIFVPFFLLMSRRQKKERAARESLKKGDRVMTNAGLVGELMEMDDALAKVKIAPGVTVQIVANTVTPFVSPSDKATAKELKEAKAVSDKK